MSIYHTVRRLFTEETPPLDPRAGGRRTDGRAEHRLRRDAESILRAAIAAVDPEELVVQAMATHARTIPADGRLWVAGFGKAVIPMARGLHRVVGDRVAGAVLIAPVGAQAYVGPQFDVFSAGHPLPDQGGEAGARAVRQLAAEAEAGDLLICLVSGGGSSLLTLPPDDVPLEEVRIVTDLLLRSGAEIDEINCVRKHIDMLKGGRLAREAAPARVLSLVLSDAADNATEIVASGPTVPDPSRFADALAVLKRYDLWKQVPLAVRGWLDRGRCGEIDDTPERNDTVFLNTSNVIIGDGQMAAGAARWAAERLGYETQVLTTALGGAAEEAGCFLAETARIVRAAQSPEPYPTCLITTGETSLRSRDSRYGSRNQQLALAAALRIDRLDGALVASMGTDGFDGWCDAAGAIATGTTIERARSAGLDCAAALADGRATSIFERLDDQIVSGPTGTDVADIQIVLMA
ncbi:MAG TPA: DUF4147 domain-containing protein [Candidatus Polarisedimenticolaceae bacterium]|nr:DUF4147 domain-containing protein [Candidatus Polarisedimenticolaceae bacterium]